MPAGTWNLGRIQKSVSYRGLKDLSTIRYTDETTLSEDYFNVTQFPEKLTGGKNLIKLNAANDRLVDDSKIHIEILDYNGKPVYYEPLNYLEKDGTRVIAIYVYKKSTSPGVGTVYIAGRAAYDRQGNAIPYSLDSSDSDFKDFPNLIWSRQINIAPDKENTSEIIHTIQPRVTVTERVVPYLEPIDLTNVYITKQASSGATIKIDPIPVTAPQNTAQYYNNIISSTALAFDGLTLMFL